MAKNEDNFESGTIQSTDLDYLYEQVKDMSDLYYLSFILLSKLENTKYQTISELAYLLGPKSFQNLLWYFEGMVIRIPTREELNYTLQLISFYYYHNILKKSWEESMASIGMVNNPDNSRELGKRYRKFIKDLENVKFPDHLRDIQKGMGESE